MKQCADCKIDLPDIYTFCTQCGGGLTEIIVPSKVDATCPSCGANMKREWRFCKICAFDVNDQRTMLAPTQVLPHPDGPRTDIPLYVGKNYAERAPASVRPARMGLILAGISVVLLLGISSAAGYYFWFSNAAIEKKLDAAITTGSLFKPEGSSAYDLYNQLKQNGAKDEKLARYRDRLLPVLTTQPLKMLADFAVPTNREPGLSEWQEAQKPIAWASELKPNDGTLTAKAKYIEGRIAYLSNKKDDALNLWKGASDFDKSWALATNAVGVIYNERKEYQTARQFALEAIRREPNWAVPYNNVGTSYFLEKNDNKAESYYRQAIERAPNWPRPHVWLGDIAMRRKNYDQAVREYEATLNLAVPGTTTLNLLEIKRRLELARKKSEQVEEGEFIEPDS